MNQNKHKLKIIGNSHNLKNFVTNSILALQYFKLITLNTKIQDLFFETLFRIQGLEMLLPFFKNLTTHIKIISSL